MLFALLTSALAGAPSNPYLELSNTDVAGGNTLSYSVTYADPGTSAWLVATGTRSGRGACPARLAGDCFTYGPGFTIIARGTTDAHGAWSGELHLPDTVQGGAKGLQVAASFGGALMLSNAQVVTFHPYCDPDGWEDDDTENLSNALDNHGVEDSLLVCEGDEDWVSVDVPAGARAVAYWTHNPNEGQLEVTYYASAGLGTYFASDTTSLGLAKLRWTNNEGADAVTWFQTRVVADQAGAGVPYTLRWYVESTDADDCDEDIYEDNDSLASATPLSPGVYTGLTSCGDFNGVDEDYYAVELLAGEVIDVDVLFSHGDADIDIDLRDELGAVVASSGGTSDNESLSYIAPADGTYAIRVGLYQDGIAGPTAEGAPYTLDFSVTTP